MTPTEPGQGQVLVLAQALQQVLAPVLEQGVAAVAELELVPDPAFWLVLLGWLKLWSWLYRIWFAGRLT